MWNRNIKYKLISGLLLSNAKWYMYKQETLFWHIRTNNILPRYKDFQLEEQRCNKMVRYWKTELSMVNMWSVTLKLLSPRRKKVGLLATQKWGAGNFPKFNTLEMKTQLKTFASDIEGECSIPEIGFTYDALRQHIQDYFNEQCRYKKRNGQQV